MKIILGKHCQNTKKNKGRERRKKGREKEGRKEGRERWSEFRDKRSK